MLLLYVFLLTNTKVSLTSNHGSKLLGCFLTKCSVLAKKKKKHFSLPEITEEDYWSLGWVSRKASSLLPTCCPLYRGICV